MSKPFIYINQDAWKDGKLDWCTYEYKHGDCDNFKHRYNKPLYESAPQPDRVAELEAKLKVALFALNHVKPATRNIDQNAWDTIEQSLKQIGGTE